jgi:hypothetical protein
VLLNYLQSYSGLEELRLTRATSSNQAASNKLADRFYDLVLPKHISSLTNVEIYACYEGNWCFGRHTVAIISRIPNLTRLCVGLHSANIYGRNINKEADNAVVC